mmetsp:Transcript_8986/g.30501  ORF Transcript_8986/g.30501 Transcript_8986/m.30501 type:complete len:312 (-) Transcript_8986:174-1109(-)
MRALTNHAPGPACTARRGHAQPQTGSRPVPGRRGGGSRRPCTREVPQHLITVGMSEARLKPNREHGCCDRLVSVGPSHRPVRARQLPVGVDRECKRRRGPTPESSYALCHVAGSLVPGGEEVTPRAGDGRGREGHGLSVEAPGEHGDDDDRSDDEGGLKEHAGEGLALLVGAVARVGLSGGGLVRARVVLLLGLHGAVHLGGRLHASVLGGSVGGARALAAVGGHLPGDEHEPELVEEVRGRRERAGVADAVEDGGLHARVVGEVAPESDRRAGLGLRRRHPAVADVAELGGARRPARRKDEVGNLVDLLG